MTVNFCPSCGKAVVEGTRFCMSCGTPLEPTTPVPESATPAPPPAPPPAPTGPRRSLLSRLAPVAVVVGLLSSGFGLYRVLSSDSGSTPTEATTRASVIASTAHCENATLGYSLDYPADWYTQPDHDGSPCAFFNPTPFEAPTGSGTLVEVAVRVIDVALPIDTVVADGARIAGRDGYTIENTDTTVGGHPAIRSVETSGADELDYSYLVDLGDHTLSVEVQGLWAPDFDQAKQVVDLMARSLELT